MKIKHIIITCTLSAAILFVNGCGGGGDTSASSDAVSSYDGVVVDAPVEGLSYRCGDIQSTTDNHGVFHCNTLPVVFSVGGIELGSLAHIPADGYVTPQDMAGVSRTQYNNTTVANIALLLQSLDDDGQIAQTIALNSTLVEKLKTYHQQISDLNEDEVIDILNQIDAPYVTSTDAALIHLQNQTQRIDPALTETVDTTEEALQEQNTSVLDDAVKQAYLDLINEARSEGRECGDTYMPAVEPLTWSDTLYNAAYEHSKDMALSDTFSHTGSGTQSDETAQILHPGEGSSVGERIERNGYTNWHMYGENIAAGTVMDEAVNAMEAWLESPDHCMNIMQPDFKEVGMALYYEENSHYLHYWTQDFGTPNSH